MKHSGSFLIIALILGSVCFVFYMHRNDTPIYKKDVPVVDSVLSKENSDSSVLNDSTLKVEKNNNNSRIDSNASPIHKDLLSGVNALFITSQKYSEQNKDNLSSNTESSQRQKHPLKLQGKTRKNKAKRTYSGQCQATTKKGRQCLRKAEPGRRYCWQHS